MCTKSLKRAVRKRGNIPLVVELASATVCLPSNVSGQAVAARDNCCPWALGFGREARDSCSTSCKNTPPPPQKKKKTKITIPLLPL